MNGKKDTAAAGVLPEVTRQVESLLRASRSYQPDSAPTEGLAARALARHRVRAEARRRTVRKLTLAGSLATAAAAVTYVFFWQGVGAQKPFPQAVPVAQAAPEQPPVPVKTHPPSLLSPSRPSKPAAAVPVRLKLRERVVTPRKPAASARSPRRERIKRPRPRRAPRAPEAQWVVHTVRRDTYGVLAPAWIAQADEANGEVDVTPVVVDIPVHTEERVIAAAHTDSGDSVPPITYDSEENR